MNNPLLSPSPLPYQLPPFEQIRNEHFLPAFEKGMIDELREVEAIASNAAKPTFENTLVALERSGQLLARTNRAFNIYTSANTNPELKKLESLIAPRLAAHHDAIKLNPDLFARIEELHRKRESLKLDRESDYLLERYFKDFVRAGARLPAADKERLKALNAELASLATTFAQNVLEATNSSAVWVEDCAALAGMPEDQIAAAATAATKEGRPGKYLLRLQNTTGQPPLASLENRELRLKLLAASLSRCNDGGPQDNRAVVARLARLRAERAALLGYASHAALQLEEQTAQDVGPVNEMLAKLAPAAVANARREAADIQAMIDATGGRFKLTAADWEFYSEKVRAARYAFDESQLKPYFELKRVLVDGVFFAATRLYGVKFRERPDLKGYDADMVVYEVFDRDGTPLALFLGDFYARPNKRGGAWASAYVPQSHLLDRKPVIGNHLNIPKPPDGEPTLMTYDQVETLFHEFGHALHGMFSDVKYPRFAGTSVPRDFVEFPSQVNEMWMTWPEVLGNYAKHHRTGEPMPPELLSKVTAAEQFNQGYKTTEYLAAALLDQAWHQLAADEVPAADRVLAFEAAALGKAGVDFAPVPPRYRSTYFSHVFSGGYSAGYYSYIWSEVLDADTVEWFRRNGGLDRANGDRFRRMLLSQGGSRDAMELYREFRGGEPDIAPLLRRRGLDVQAPAAAAGDN